jgi:hypothetical protein
LSDDNYKELSDDEIRWFSDDLSIGRSEEILKKIDNHRQLKKYHRQSMR